MKLSQLLTYPNQLTLLRMMFLPFIVIHLVSGHYRWALILFVIAGNFAGLEVEVGLEPGPREFPRKLR